ncbi:hypothetical protein EI42_03744 [Thermosporothrix hazakensis]|jgi:hypothetical protein|uniref:Uncharacterized protein n=1 Tax=Thermosporothrix hazakensis TaxID=644383 RepID=A0A326UCN8_THEHA|nr:hypothetical protein EI42_03744 [Thermosporothrix hazakensis]
MSFLSTKHRYTVRLLLFIILILFVVTLSTLALLLFQYLLD